MMRATIAVLLLLSASAHADPEETPPEVTMEEIRLSTSEGTATGMAQGLSSQAEFWADHGVGIYESTVDFINAYRALTHPDENCIDLGDVGAPAVPTSCEDNEQCGQCYTQAQRRLDGMRLNLERLRCVYTAAANFTKASIAFGDTTSGIHAVTGLEWQTQKAGIQREFENLQHTYDTKYGQMLPNLRAALEAIGQCEAQFFSNRDWYNRFGFIYYTFMADRYKRSD